MPRNAPNESNRLLTSALHGPFEVNVVSDTHIQRFTFPYRVDYIPRRCRKKRFAYIAEHDVLALRRMTLGLTAPIFAAPHFHWVL